MRWKRVTSSARICGPAASAGRPAPMVSRITAANPAIFMESLLGGGEIEMPVLMAAGIEARPAGRAPAVAGEVFAHAQLPTAGSAEHRGLIPLGFGPDLGRMVGQLVVALAAGVVGPAAGHLDGDDVEVAMPVGAAGPRVQRLAMDGGAQARGRVGHGARGYCAGGLGRSLRAASFGRAGNGACGSAWYQ